MNLDIELEHIWDILKCIRCREIKCKQEIFHCSSSHLMCNDCKEHSSAPCVLCDSYFYNRNKCVENLMQWIPLPCPNRGKGCNVVLKDIEMDNHLDICSYARFKCPVEGCTTMLSNESFLNHVSCVHDNICFNKQVCEGKEFKFCLNTPSSHDVRIFNVDEWGVFLYQGLYIDKYKATLHCVQLAATKEPNTPEFVYTISEERQNKFASFTCQVETAAASIDALVKRGNCMIIGGKLDEANTVRRIVITVKIHC